MPALCRTGQEVVVEDECLGRSLSDERSPGGVGTRDVQPASLEPTAAGGLDLRRCAWSPAVRSAIAMVKVGAGF
jgi:hypothetical protein